MEEIEESAINSSSVPPKIWKRYVDDSFCIIKKDNVPAFHDTLNSIDANISFTIEIESDNKISFLDTLVTRRNGTIAVDVYRKPTHTDRYFRTRKILEAWHSKLTPNADNNSCPLPGQYNILFNKHS